MTWRTAVEQLCRDTGGTVAVVVRELGGDEQFTYAEDRVFPAASVIKVPLLAAVYRQARAGVLDLERRYPVLAEEWELVGTRGSGILQHLRPGLCPTLYDLATLAIIVSDNIATNMLIEAVGMEAVTEYLVELGYTRTRMLTKIGDYEAMAAGHDNTISAGEVADLLARIYHGQVVDRAACDEMLKILSRQRYGQIRNAVPRGTTVASKSGNLPGIRHDVGIVYARRPYVLAVLTEKLQDVEAGVETIAALTRVTLGHFQ
jgi:beta-lactamase class A